jgi:hypothetical protein
MRLTRLVLVIKELKIRNVDSVINRISLESYLITKLRYVSTSLKHLNILEELVRQLGC